MTTIPDSLKATLDAGWTAAGGAEPTYYVKEDYNAYNMPPAGKDYIWIDTTSHKKTPKPVNETYANITNTIDIYVNTLTTADRRKEIADEVVRILNGTAITGVSVQWISDRAPVRPDKIRAQHMEKIQVTMLELMAASSSAYGGTAPSLTQAQLEDLIMFGSGNAAWVPCTYELAYTNTRVAAIGGFIVNTGTDNPTLVFGLPLPTLKGTLKLYVSGTKIGVADADSDAYITDRVVVGHTSTRTTLDSNLDNLTTVAEHSDTFTAVDCSSYTAIKFEVGCVVDAANELDIAHASLRCYYA